MAGRYIKKRKKAWYSNIPVPARQREHHGGASKVEVSLKTRDEAVAERLAMLMAAELHLMWAARDGCGQSAEALRRTVYEKARDDVLSGKLRLENAAYPTDHGIVELDPVEAAVDVLVDDIRDSALHREQPEDTPWAAPQMTVEEQARVDGLIDGLREYQGRTPVSRTAYEPPFADTAERWLAEWERRPGRKEANTGKQYAATIRMFKEWWGGRPMRAIKPTDAAAYVSHLRSMAAGDARHRRTSKVEKNKGAGLSDATINRHVGTLKAIWKWAKQRGKAEGDNPWDGFKTRLTKQNTDPYLAWSTPELRTMLVDNPPPRRDLYELALVGLYSGMRISEAADLTWGQLIKEEGIWYINIDDAKTDAGIRRLPLHERLLWLAAKSRGKADEPVWPKFNPEGPSKSRGDDASRMFGEHKRSLGFLGRAKSFHSFRKNVTAQMEELEVPPNVWARSIGHEPGFTYKTYNPAGLTLPKMREIINRINYRGLSLPTPADLYGGSDRIKRHRRVPAGPDVMTG